MSVFTRLSAAVKPSLPTTQSDFSEIGIVDNPLPGPDRSPSRSRTLRAQQLGWDTDPDPAPEQFTPGLGDHISYSQARRMGVLPVQREPDRTVVWVRPDIDWNSWIELQAEFGLDIHPVVIDADAFDRALQMAFERGGAAADAVLDMDQTIDLEAVTGLPETADLLDSEDDAPIIRLLNALLTQAIKDCASDIHVEPFESRVIIRCRVDGILSDMVEAPGALSTRIVSRIKVMARLNIAEKRVPQDGRISVKLAGRTVDIRVSTVPTHYGERVVLRILEKEKGPLRFDQIGMPAEIQGKLNELIHSAYGIFLVTGPTGSGKTTTLYAALQQVRRPDVNIITVEDPIEYDLQGVGQIPVNPKTGMTFVRGLRAILRQDPDVIMVGEIRDQETAEVAVQASLTGHRVFSTLHTNDAPGSVIRIVDMGIEPYLVASSLLGAMGQRLVRKLCLHCREPRLADAGERQLLNAMSADAEITLYQPRGCRECAHTGYRGRTGIYELMVINDEIRQLIHDKRPEQEFREAACRQGMNVLREDGLAKARAGITSLEEVLRVSRS